MERMAEHVVSRLEELYMTDYKESNPHASLAKVEKYLEGERQYLMPGGGKTREKNIQDMKTYLFRGMDVNHDGKLTQSEFKFSWNSTVGPLFVVRTESSSVGCSIC